MHAGDIGPPEGNVAIVGRLQDGLRKNRLGHGNSALHADGMTWKDNGL